MIRSHAFELINDRRGGGFADELRFWHQCRVPATAITRMITALTSVEVSDETVKRWLRYLEAGAA